MKFKSGLLILTLISILVFMSCMKATLDFSSPENVVATFGNAAQFGNYSTFVEITTGDLKKELETLDEVGLEKRFGSLKNGHFSYGKKTMNMDIDNSYIIPVRVLTEEGKKENFQFYVILEDNKWLIFKIVGGKNV